MVPIRWPWPIFRLMQRPLRASLTERRDVARLLLEEDDLSLEDLSNKIRSTCLGELHFISPPLGSFQLVVNYMRFWHQWLSTCV